MSEGTLLDAGAKDADLKSAFAALSKDYGSLTARVRALGHSVVCTCSGVTLRLHFPAFRQSKPTLSELVDAIAVYLVHFALPRSEVEALTALYKTIDAAEFMKRYSLLESRARALFIKANETTERSGDPAVETTFGRLYSDYKRGLLNGTLDRAGVAGSAAVNAFASALVAADEQITLPPEVIRLSPSISAHKQERLFVTLSAEIVKGRDQAAKLVPDHPRDSDAFESYARILKQCHDLILGLDTTRALHRFHALMALKWMRGLPLPQIIDEQIRRDTRGKDQRTIIRETLELIEGQIRFQAVRLFGCYNTLLRHALMINHFEDLALSIPSLPLYLEVGASDKTMISFIALGLSRVTAMRLNDLSARKDFDTAGALQWLRSRQLEQLGLSPLLLDELRSMLAVK